MNTLTSRSFLILISTIFIFGGCAQLTVTGLAQGERNGETTTVHSNQIKNGKVKSVNRVQKFGGQPAGESVENLLLQVKAVESNNPPDFAEDYYYLVLTSEDEEVFGGTAEDPNFIPNHLGKMSFMKVNQSESRAEAIPQQGDAHAGAAWLARVKNDDRKVPWNVASGSNCLQMGAGDCFDMETLSRLLFDGLAAAVEEGVRDQVPLVQNIHHRLHFVPQVDHPGLGANNRPAKGFGFIYYAKISIVGASFEVYVPLNFLFVSSDRYYLLFIDPLQLDPSEEQTSGQVYVKENLLGGFDFNLTEEDIRETINAAVAAAELPEIHPEAEFSEAIIMGITSAAGYGPAVIPTNYNFLLTPTGDNRNLSNTILWDQPVVGGAVNVNQVELHILER